VRVDVIGWWYGGGMVVGFLKYDYTMIPQKHLGFPRGWNSGWLLA